VAALAAAAGVDLSSVPIRPTTGPYFGWQEGHAASVGDIAEGWNARFGLINLALSRSLGLAGGVYAGIFAVRPEWLPDREPRPRHSDMSPFPPALRDLALAVDRAAPSAEVRAALERIGREATGAAFALERISLFDVYEGAGLPEDRKSLAFSLVFRAADRTLTDAEVNAAFQRIQQEVARSTPYLVRK
jgi:phenylalanyl-tRNA synthetase beta chain